MSAPTIPAGAGAAGAAPEPPAFERGDEVELADAARVELDKDGLTYDMGCFWQYSPTTGIWVELRGEAVNQVIASFAGAPIATDKGIKALRLSSRQIAGARTILRDTLLSDPERRKFVNAASGLAFKNGFVTVTKGKIQVQPHSPDHLARHSYPFDYESRKHPKKLGTFLRVLFGDVSHRERLKRIALLQEFVGTCLIGEATTYQQVLTLHGGGNNGKSAALEIGRAAFPPGSVASLPPHMWGERFQIARLSGVLGNFVDEVPEHDITAEGIFKSIVTGEPVSAENKNQPPFEFKPIAGHIFSANTLPGTSDQSDGYWRRQSVLLFTRRMQDVPERQPGAAAAVIAAERAEIVGWFLKGAARVQTQGGYTVPASSAEAMKRWQTEADPVLRFAEDGCVVVEVGGMHPGALFTAYSEWARANNFRPMTSGKFFRRFAKTMIEKRHTHGGNIYMCRVV